jgi:hypothetical protein
MNKAVIGIIESRSQADAILAELQSAGFRPANMSVLFPDSDGTKAFAHEHNTKAPEGAVAGAGTGGVVGGTVGLLAGIGALAIPGLGPFIAAGPLLAALSGAAAGATVGGLTGALIGMGIPEYEAKLYEGRLKKGNLLISAHTENGDQEKLARDIFKRNGAEDVATKSEASVPKEQRP